MGVAFYLANQTTQRSYQSAQKISKRQSKTSKLEKNNTETLTKLKPLEEY